MASTISPNMSLIVPTVGQELGPQYAFDINADLSLMDSHDHSPGKGVQITPAGININSALSFNNNPATSLSAVTFTSQASPNTALGTLSVAPGSGTGIGDLYYTDFAGNTIQITKSGQVNVVASSIPGESYSAGTFIWTQTQSSLPTTPANFDIGSIIIRPNIAGTVAGIQLVPPTNSSVAQITLPQPASAGSAAMPNFVTMNSSGVQLDTYNIDNVTLNVSGTNVQVKPGGITTTQISSSAGILGSQLSSSANIEGSQLAASAGILGTQIANQTITQNNLALRSSSSPGAPAGGVAISDSSGDFRSDGTTNQIALTTAQTATISVASPAVISVSSTSNLYVGQPIVFTTTGSLPTGIVSGTTYYISNIPVAGQFNISSTVYGTNINTSGSQSGVHTATFNMLSIAITTTGRPVMITLIPDGSANAACIGPVSVSGTSFLTQTMYLYNGTSVTSISAMENVTPSTSGAGYPQTGICPGSFSYIDTPAAGNYSYSIKIQSSLASSNELACIRYSKLIAYEL
jgi:hypothetical protein